MRPELIPHELYTATGPDEFNELFSQRCGTTITQLVGEFLDPPFGAVLTGSIPMGIGSSASDVDLLVFKPSTQPFRDFSRLERSDGLIVFDSPEDPRARMTCLQFPGGVEVETTFLDAEFVADALTSVLRARSVASDRTRMLLGRLLTGWWLVEDLPQQRQLSDANLHLRTAFAVQDIISAQKAYDDAVADAHRDPDVSVHLARLCVEEAMKAYLASAGILYSGRKWMRLFSTTVVSRWAKAPEVAAELGAKAMPLLFPTRARTENEALAYLDAVGHLMRDVRQSFAHARSIEFALSLSRQVPA